MGETLLLGRVGDNVDNVSDLERPQEGGHGWHSMVYSHNPAFPSFQGEQVQAAQSSKSR